MRSSGFHDAFIIEFTDGNHPLEQCPIKTKKVQGMNKAKKKDIQSAIVIILFAIAFYGFSFQIQATTSDVLGSRFFPQAAAVGLVILGLVQIVRSFTSKEELTPEQEEKLKKTGRINKPLVLTTVLLFAYYFLCVNIGFLFTSILYLLGSSWVLMPEEERKSKKALIVVFLVSVIFPIFLNTVFYRVFNIKLPVGRLF